MRHSIAKFGLGAIGMMLAAGLGVHLQAQAQAQAPTAGGSPAPAASGGGPAGWSLGAQYLQLYDTNATLAANPVADTSSSLNLDLQGQWQGPRWSFLAMYIPQAAAYARHPELSYFSQSYRQFLTYSAGPHTRLTWNVQAARYPQRAGMPGVGLAGLSGAQSASQGLGMASVLTTGNTSLALNHQYSSRGSWTAGFDTQMNAFSPDRRLLAVNGSPGVSLEESEHALSLEGSVEWRYQVAAHTSLGVSASDSDLRYTHSGPRLQYSSLAMQIRHQIGTWSLHAGAGPSWTRNMAGIELNSLHGQGYDTEAGLTKQFGTSESGILWQHNLQPSYVPGALATDVVALQYGTQWGRNWRGSLSAGYSRESQPQAITALRFNTKFASASLSWQITSAWLLQAGGSFHAQPLAFLGEGAGNLRQVEASVGIGFHPGGVR
ncbi:MAG: hypothetical protein ACRD1C_04625 [Terriglobales bacterium]